MCVELPPIDLNFSLYPLLTSIYICGIIIAPRMYCNKSIIDLLPEVYKLKEYDCCHFNNLIIKCLNYIFVINYKSIYRIKCVVYILDTTQKIKINACVYNHIKI